MALFKIIIPFLAVFHFTLLHFNSIKLGLLHFTSLHLLIIKAVFEESLYFKCIFEFRSLPAAARRGAARRADNGGSCECPPQPSWTGVAMGPCFPYSRDTHTPGLPVPVYEFLSTTHGTTSPLTSLPGGSLPRVAGAGGRPFS